MPTLSTLCITGKLNSLTENNSHVRIYSCGETPSAHTILFNVGRNIGLTSTTHITSKDVPKSCALRGYNLCAHYDRVSH